MNSKFRILRDPTLQFIISLLLAPLLAIFGTSVGTAETALVWSLGGWLVTLLIWSVLSIRSASHLWRMNSRGSSPWFHSRLLVGITFFAMMVVVTAVIVTVMLVKSLIR